MAEDLMTPETPREFALVEQIKMLKKVLARNGYSQQHYCLGDNEPIIRLPRDHPETLRVANLTATNIYGQWSIHARGMTCEPGEYYEFSQYIERPEDDGWRTTSRLASLHKDFIFHLGSYLTDQFGDTWEKYGNKERS